MHETDQEDERWIRPPRRPWYWRGILTGFQILMSLLCVATSVFFVVLAWTDENQTRQVGLWVGALVVVPLFAVFFLISIHSAYHLWVDPWHGMQTTDLAGLSVTEGFLTRLFHREWRSIRPMDQVEFMQFNHGKVGQRDLRVLDRLIEKYPHLLWFRIHRIMVWQERGNGDEAVKEVELMLGDALTQGDHRLRAIFHGWLLAWQLDRGDNEAARKELKVLRTIPFPVALHWEILDGVACMALKPEGERFRPFAHEVMREAESLGVLPATMRGTQGALWVIEGRCVEGKKMLLDVLEETDREFDVRIIARHLAQACEGLGEREEARRWARAAEIWCTPTHLPEWRFSASQP